MTFAWLKRFTPRSLYGRAALILLVPVITIQLVVSVVFIQRHFEDVTRQMTRNLVSSVGALVDSAVDAADSWPRRRTRSRRLIGPLALQVAAAGAGRDRRPAACLRPVGPPGGATLRGGHPAIDRDRPGQRPARGADAGR